MCLCGVGSDNIIQLDGEGKKKLATIATRGDGLDDAMVSLLQYEHSIHHCGTASW